MLLQKALRVQGRHAAGAGAGDGLTVDVVLHVAGRKDARHAGGGGIAVAAAAKAKLPKMLRKADKRLLAPLAPAGGGLGLCRTGDKEPQPALVFASTADADYQTLRAAIRETQALLERVKRFDMPGFRPRTEWVREMKRYGVLPDHLPANAPLSPYAVEQEYWKSLWYRPAS